jgi:hypothetical protein
MSHFLMLEVSKKTGKKLKNAIKEIEKKEIFFSF